MSGPGSASRSTSRRVAALGTRARALSALCLAFFACERWSSGVDGVREPDRNGTTAEAGMGGADVDSSAPLGEGPKAGGGSGGSTPLGEGGDGASETSLPYAEPEPDGSLLPARTFRLSHAQYAASIGAVLGKTLAVPELDRELDNGVYPNMAVSGLVRTPLARDYYAQAKRVVDELTLEELQALVPGGALSLDAKTEFVAGVVTRAFRRPATAAEQRTYEELFELGASEGDVMLGFRTVLRALFTAPYFLYRTEIGADSDATEVALTSYEVAALLSYGLLDTPPSAALLASAERGELEGEGELARVVGELVATSEAAENLRGFAREWLKLDRFQPEAESGPALPEKDARLFPEFDAARGAMLDEAESFLTAHAAPGSTLGELLTSKVPPASGALGEFYASEPSATSAGVRTGVLALGSLLSVYAREAASSPTQRGHFVRERLLCQPLELPAVQPPELEATAEREATRTTRELYELHERNPACAGCHVLLDEVGFAFESFDAAGRFRESEHGAALDTRAELSGTDVDGTYADHAALARALARSDWVRECVATQAFRRYFGALEGSRGATPIQAARRALTSGSFADMLAALFGTESTYRRVRE